MRLIPRYGLPDTALVGVPVFALLAQVCRQNGTAPDLRAATTRLVTSSRMADCESMALIPVEGWLNNLTGTLTLLSPSVFVPLGSLRHFSNQRDDSMQDQLLQPLKRAISALNMIPLLDDGWKG